MTDTYIWKCIKKRFYSMSQNEYNEETGEMEIKWFPFFKKLDGDDYIPIEYPDFKDEDYIIDREITLNVIEPNTTTKRPTDTIWFNIFPLHSIPHQVEWGMKGRNRWLFGLQIDINASRNGDGTYGTDDIDEAYDFIASNFKRGDSFDGIRVLQTAYRSSARNADDYYSVPVTIMVQADLKN